jgi:hypothetical protein
VDTEAALDGQANPNGVPRRDEDKKLIRVERHAAMG